MLIGKLYSKKENEKNKYNLSDLMDGIKTHVTL